MKGEQVHELFQTQPRDIGNDSDHSNNSCRGTYRRSRSAAQYRNERLLLRKSGSVSAVTPRGWLRKQLELQSAGFHGHLGEISEFLRKQNNAWLSTSGKGERGWEEVPYWLKGFGDCAYLLKNEEQIREAKIWIEAAIKSHRDDGFFGPRGVQSTVESTKGKYDLWPNMIMLCCLQSYYEFTGDAPSPRPLPPGERGRGEGDPRVLDLMTKYFHWEL